MIEANVVCDSIANGVRLTTLQLRYPRFIHAEFMTHRMFSRNASSSRAIPVKKMLERISKEPAMPIHWGKNKPGMQAEEENNVPVNGMTPQEAWVKASADALNHAAAFSDAGYHKQVVNRLTEPFQHIDVIVTATEWHNFFKLRLHPDAQPEIQALAQAMKEAMDMSIPNPLTPEEYHLPYCTEEEKKKLSTLTLIKCSVARCARVSYLNHDQTEPDVEKDCKLHDRLLADGHMSPFEHVAKPMNLSAAGLGWMHPEDDGSYKLEDGVTHLDRDGNPWSGNFLGWIQYRQVI